RSAKPASRASPWPAALRGEIKEGYPPAGGCRRHSPRTAAGRGEAHQVATTQGHARRSRNGPLVASQHQTSAALEKNEGGRSRLQRFRTTCGREETDTELGWTGVVDPCPKP